MFLHRFIAALCSYKPIITLRAYCLRHLLVALVYDSPYFTNIIYFFSPAIFVSRIDDFMFSLAHIIIHCVEDVIIFS